MRAIMLLHGFCTDKNDFLPLLPKIEGLYDFVWNKNLPGHSKDEHFKGFTADNTFNYILNEYDELKVTYDQVDCVGFSMGGALATYLQAMRKIDNLVLLAPANQYINFKYMLNRGYLRYLEILNRKSKDTTFELTMLDKRLESIKADDKNSFKMGIKTLLPNYTIKNIITFRRIIKKCNDNLKEITPPTLIVWGHLDQLVPKESIKYDYSICSNDKKELLIVPDLSHLMFRSNQIDTILDKVKSFLS